MKDMKNLIIGLLSAVALLAVIGGAYMYYTNESNEPGIGDQQAPSNTVATDESSTSTATEHKVMKPTIPDDGKKEGDSQTDDDSADPKQDPATNDSDQSSKSKPTDSENNK